MERFPALTALCLTHSPVNDDAVASVVQRYQELKHFCLGGTRITGACLLKLATLRELEELSLSGTGIGDDEVAVLAELPALKVLNLTNTKVTEAAVEKLRE
jgi:hypothetical protein